MCRPASSATLLTGLMWDIPPSSVRHNIYITVDCTRLCCCTAAIPSKVTGTHDGVLLQGLFFYAFKVLSKVLGGVQIKLGQQAQRENCQSHANWVQTDGSVTSMKLMCAFGLLPGSNGGIFSTF